VKDEITPRAISRARELSDAMSYGRLRGRRAGGSGFIAGIAVARNEVKERKEYQQAESIQE